MGRWVERDLTWCLVILCAFAAGRAYGADAAPAAARQVISFDEPVSLLRAGDFDYPGSRGVNGGRTTIYTEDGMTLVDGVVPPDPRLGPFLYKHFHLGYERSDLFPTGQGRLCVEFRPDDSCARSVPALVFGSCRDPSGNLVVPLTRRSLIGDFLECPPGSVFRQLEDPENQPRNLAFHAAGHVVQLTYDPNGDGKLDPFNLLSLEVLKGKVNVGIRYVDGSIAVYNNLTGGFRWILLDGVNIDRATLEWPRSREFPNNSFIDNIEFEPFSAPRASVASAFQTAAAIERPERLRKRRVRLDSDRPVPRVFEPSGESLRPLAQVLAPGTGMLSAGAGLSAAQPASFSFDVPGRVKQVFLYWLCHFSQGRGDGWIGVEGRTVKGTSIGGPSRFFGDTSFGAWRADITELGLVGQGANTLTLRGLSCPMPSLPARPATLQDGADGGGVIVIFEQDGEDVEPATIDLHDGLDLAFAGFAPPNDGTFSQWFVFPPADHPRTGTLVTLAGSVSGAASGGGALRSNRLVVSFDVGDEVVFANPWASISGEEFDAVDLPLEIPAGASNMIVTAFSGGPGAFPASFAWIAAGLAIPASE